jgi:ribosomal protein L21E
MNKEYNKGYKYLFIFIDVFSRYVDAIMLKDKGEDECLNAIKLILSYNKINPKVIMSDSESAFLSSKFINFLESKDINLEPVILNNHHALGIIDRFCRTLKTRLTKLFLARNSTEWINDISNIIYQYNNTENRGILNFSPQEVIDDKEKSERILKFNIIKQQKNINLRQTSNIKEGDKVRLYINDTFKKGSEQNYSTKSYNVVGKKGKNILLDNGQKVVESNLLKINNGEYLKNHMMINDGEDEEATRRKYY